MNKETQKTKFLKGMKDKKDLPFAGQPFDVVIPVMGPTGVGKSTFINSLLESIGKTKRVKVGHGLESTTSQMNPVIIEFGQGTNGFKNPNSGEGRLVIVDTPGFDDTYIDSMEILRRISVWLGFSYATNMKLGGVIYLHDITQSSSMRTTERVFNTFQKLVGADAQRCVVLGTTKWQLVNPAVGAKREEQLKSQFWQEMIKRGSQVVRVHDRDAPRQVVDNILNRATLTKSKVEFLMIQKELVQMRKLVPQTEAGQTLLYSLDELIKPRKSEVEKLTDEEFEKGKQKLGQVLKTAKELKVPLGARIMNFFGF